MRIVLPDGREQSRTSRRDWSVPPESLENDRAVFEVNEGQTVDHVRVGGEDDGVISLMGGKRRYLAMETLLHPLPEEAAA